MKSVYFHPEAELEMVQQARYYETKQEGLGKRFLESVQASCRQIQLFPHIFQSVDDLYRRCCLKTFPFGLVFREKAEDIQIIAAIPFRRRPGYWRTRLLPEQDALAKLQDDLMGDVKRLTNHSPEYRLRVGNYRALLEIENQERIVVYRILHRKDAYR